jgi:hypothetical protein
VGGFTMLGSVLEERPDLAGESPLCRHPGTRPLNLRSSISVSCSEGLQSEPKRGTVHQAASNQIRRDRRIPSLNSSSASGGGPRGAGLWSESLWPRKSNVARDIFIDWSRRAKRYLVIPSTAATITNASGAILSLAGGGVAERTTARSHSRPSLCAGAPQSPNCESRTLRQPPEPRTAEIAPSATSGTVGAIPLTG